VITVLTTVATFLALFTLVSIRPNLRPRLSLLKKAKRSEGDLRNQFFIGVTVENNGALGVHYRVINRAEEAFDLTGVKAETLPIGKNLDNKHPAGFYQERVLDTLMPENAEKPRYKGRQVLGYKVRHLLSAGSVTESNLHIIGDFTLCEVEAISYDDSLSDPDWISWVKIEPVGVFWGAPLIKKLNTRYVMFTSSKLLAEGVDRL